LQERARLAASFEGEALGTELRALCETYFGLEARTIEAEERSASSASSSRGSTGATRPLRAR